MIQLLILEFLIVALVAFALEHFVIIRTYETRERARAEEIARSIVADAERIRENAQKDVENVHKQALLDAKASAFEFREVAEAEIREQRSEIQKLERKLAQREEALETRSSSFDTREAQYRQRETDLEAERGKALGLIQQRRNELERVSGLNAEDAKAQYMKIVEDENRHAVAKLIRSIEEEARRDGERKARQILTDVIQRCAVDQTSETTVSVVPLPNDEMKGRIIGREGRNIRAFETLTGVDLIIDDTPEAVVLSGFDPVRREIARISLINLIVDGRIHPGRIEEIVKKAQDDVQQRIQEAGEQAVFETESTGLAPEIVQLLGKMKYRTSYGQNVLKHSIEVSHICGMLAAEIGADAWVARRAGLLHDIGKAVDFEIEGPHAVIGANILRRHRENPAVIHAVEAHHHDIEPTTLEDALVICADQISASRPGARRETLETYVKRLKKLEEIGDSSVGVEKTFAVQAGREIRIIVIPEQVDDFSAIKLARDVAKRIEDEMEYPGQIKVTVIRETRAVDFAK